MDLFVAFQIQFILNHLNMTTESLRKFHAEFLIPKISYNSHQMHDEATPSHIKYIPTTKYQTSDCMASLGKFRGKDNKEFL